MRRFTILIAMVIILLVTAIPAVATQCDAPEGAELEQFPVLTKPLDATTQAIRGLKAEVLLEPTGFLNYKGPKSEQCFTYEVLPVGTTVFVDENGEVRYKADCSNRLIDISCPSCPPAGSVLLTEEEYAALTATPDMTTVDSGDTGPGPSWYSRAASGLWDFTKFLMVLLLALLFLAVLFWLVDAAYEHFFGSSDPPPDSSDRLADLESRFGELDLRSALDVDRLEERVKALETSDNEPDEPAESDKSEEGGSEEPNSLSATLSIQFSDGRRMSGELAEDNDEEAETETA